MKLLILTLFVFFITVYGEENKPLPCSCRLNKSNRIMNGEIANDNFIPWMVSLKNEENGHSCTGSIVNENYIMTRAPCIGEDRGNITVHLAVISIWDKNESNTYRATNVTIKPIDESDDFIIFKLDRPIEFEPGKIEPACLNLEDDNFYEDDLLIAGWGDTAVGERDLLNFTNSADGKLRYYSSTQTRICDDSQICTIPKKEGSSLCFGDLGGPLMQNKNGKTYVIGINDMFGFAENFCSGIGKHIHLKRYKDIITNNGLRYCSIRNS